MTGDELKTYIKQRGMSLTQLANALGTSPQNLNAKFGRQTLKHDFLQSVMDIVNRCCPPLPAEVELAVNGSGIITHSPNANNYLGGDAALVAENKLLRQQNEFLQQQLANAMEIIKNGKG